MCLGIPGKITEIKPSAIGSEFKTGKVDFGGIKKEVNLAYVPDVKIGNYVIVHVGFAISIVDEEEAHRIFEYLKEMDELRELTT